MSKLFICWSYVWFFLENFFIFDINVEGIYNVKYFLRYSVNFNIDFCFYKRCVFRINLVSS